MALVSDRLRAARERAGLEISDVADRTKIKPAFLQAIERGEFERLPGDFFTRAFLKTYARELGVDCDAILEEYDSSRAATAGPALARRVSRAALQQMSPLSEPKTSSGTSGWTVAAVAAALLIAISLVDRAPESGRAIEPVPVGTSGIAEAAAPEPGPARPVPEEGSPETLMLEVRPAEELWIAAHADGERVLYRLLQPGELVALEARQELSLRIGNAGGFEYTINGVPGRSLGGPGEVRDLQITRENYQAYRR